MILTRLHASEAENPQSDRNKAVYLCLFADIVSLRQSSGYHKQRNTLFLKTMTVEIEFQIIGDEP